LNPRTPRGWDFFICGLSPTPLARLGYPRGHVSKIGGYLEFKLETTKNDVPLRREKDCSALCR
jgi:hypothetical protein